MEGFQLKKRKTVKVGEIIQNLWVLSYGIDNSITLATPDEAAKAKEITKFVILGLGSLTEAMLDSLALAKLMGINGSTSFPI